jgi:hypothetical protein
LRFLEIFFIHCILPSPPPYPIRLQTVSTYKHIERLMVYFRVMITTVFFCCNGVLNLFFPSVPLNFYIFQKKTHLLQCVSPCKNAPIHFLSVGSNTHSTLHWYSPVLSSS